MKENCEIIYKGIDTNDEYEKTIKNFFIDNYEEEIWDGSLHCVDIYYYSKDLRMSNSKK